MYVLNWAPWVSLHLSCSKGIWGEVKCSPFTSPITTQAVAEHGQVTKVSVHYKYILPPTS